MLHGTMETSEAEQLWSTCWEHVVERSYGEGEDTSASAAAFSSVQVLKTAF
ncbi:hypothetical protein [Corallococcus terminator]|uniref:hypothetical protein n=1 Tax=Corallococcus terminator TaxID=2316733 RepID=UPI0013155E29|nr:hypothetical protein [Corallococcus terminator]